MDLLSVPNSSSNPNLKTSQSSDDLFHSNPTKGMNLTALYNMPTPQMQQQQAQRQAFMQQGVNKLK